MRVSLFLCAFVLGACGGAGQSSTGPAGDAGDGGGGDGGSGTLGPCGVTLAVPSALCSGGVTPCPVVVDATMACGYASGLTVDVGSSGTGYAFVMLNVGGVTNTRQLIAIDTVGGHQVDIAAILAAPYDNGPAFSQFATDGAGEPHFAQATTNGITYASRGATGWAFETVSPSLDASRSYLGRLVSGAAGHAAIFYVSDMTALASRDPATGTWSSKHVASSLTPDVFGSPIPEAIALDAAGSSYAAYWTPDTPTTPKDLVLANPDGTLVTLVTSSEIPSSTNLVIPSGANAAVAFKVPSALHVLVPTGTSGHTDVAVPSTQSLPATHCGVGVSNGNCVGTTCDDLADGITEAHALATTDDGAVWVAWRQTHVEREYALQQSAGGTVSCQSTLTADRSTSTIALAKVTSAGADVRLRVPLLHDVAFDTVSLAARGSRLILGASTETGKAGGFGGRYLELDATKL